MQKHIGYHYKNSDLCAQNEHERIMFEYDNPYGYNFGATTKKESSASFAATLPRNSVNRTLLAKKR